MISITLRKIYYGMSLVVCAPFIIGCSGTSSSEQKLSLNEEDSISESAKTTTLTTNEKSEGWELLFDGQDLSKWRSIKSEEFPSEAWVVEDGALVLDKRGGDIVTREKYGDFELTWDFKLTEGANSGIKYFVDSIVNESSGDVVINGPEYQIIDDHNYAGIKDDPDGLSSTGALYLIYAPENKTLNPAGNWNHSRIVAKGRQVEHWLNGTKVLSYERGSGDYLEKMAKTKFKDYPEYGQQSEGHILLTDHQDKVYFRNIRIRKL